MARASPGGVSIAPGDLVLVKVTRSNLHRHNDHGKLEYEKWTGLWKEAKVIQKDLSVEVVRKERQLHRHRVATSVMMCFHPRRMDLSHSMAEGFSQHAWSADFELANPPHDTSPCTPW